MSSFSSRCTGFWAELRCSAARHTRLKTHPHGARYPPKHLKSLNPQPQTDFQEHVEHVRLADVEGEMNELTMDKARVLAALQGL